jgi:hypothetical protein
MVSIFWKKEEEEKLVEIGAYLTPVGLWSRPKEREPNWLYELINKPPRFNCKSVKFDN